MATLKALGRLKQLSVREIWQLEDRDFTPWLAEAPNLEVLSETLGLELELEAQEKFVGKFRADMLCKTVGGDDHWVLIENQLERTDHLHLGQLLTYASGLDAVTIIWIAARFTEEHRATLDWLNRITDESFRFFGIEVEIWAIGDSLAAPRFNIVSKPNDWTKSVARAARAIESGELSDTKKMQIEYWTAFHRVLDAIGGPVSGSRKPQPQGWMGYSVGKTGVSVNAVINTTGNSMRAEVYLQGANAKSHFHQLLEHQQDIDDELDFELQWDELPNGMDSRIYHRKRPTMVSDRTLWPQQHDWLARKVNALHSAFAPYVRQLS